MHLRPVTLAECSATASISVDAFWNDELYTYTHPRREQYPDDFRDQFLRCHRRRFWSPGFVFHVAVTNPEDAGHEKGGKVVGYAIWERRGTSEKAKAWRKDSPRALLERVLLQATDTYIALTGGDRSVDLVRLKRFYDETKEGFTKIPEIWKLQNLCVHVDFQRRGIGSMLIDWGKTEAEDERCPIGLESSEVARSTYRRNGFRKYGDMFMKDFPIDDVPTFIWEPPGLEGNWGMERSREQPE